MTTRMPKGWRTGHGGDVACPHRDLSCCPECARRPEVLEIYGQHFWVPGPGERAALVAQMAENEAEIAAAEAQADAP